jgi:hypothetical protein
MNRLKLGIEIIAILAVSIVAHAAPSASAADEDNVRRVFFTYWKSFASSDFSAAGATISPDDLVAAKRELLPVFLTISENPAKDAQQFTSAFFGQLPASKRTGLTPLEVYASLNRLIASVSLDMFKALSSATTEIDRVQISDSDAIVHYRVVFQGISNADTEALVKKDGKWWLRLKENPQETAKKFRMLFK